MTWSLTSLRPQERRLGLIAGVIVGCWGLIDLAVEPLWHGAVDARHHVTARSQKLEAVRHLLDQAPTIEQEYQQYASYLAAGEQADSQEALLRDLEALSRRAQLQLNLKPRAGRAGARSGNEVEVDVEGAQANVLQFLDAVLAMPRLIRIERLRISSIPTRSEQVRGNLVISQLSPR